MNIALAAIHDERELIALARDLGAERFGGNLSATEKRKIASAKAFPTSRSLLTEIRKQIREGKDPLGEVFCALRSPLERRDVGAFFTPSFIVGPMVQWALKQRPTRVVDVGCGSGRFTQRVLLSSPKTLVTAVDLDPLASLLTRAILAVLRAQNARVVNGDYLKFSLPHIESKTAYIGNPPYVRHHELTPEVKANASLTAARLGHSISGLAGLHALFFLHTAAVADKGDVGCFVTSAEWLDTNYGSIVRDLMTNGLGGKHIASFAPNTVAFEDAMTTAAISYFEVGCESSHISFLMTSDVKRRRFDTGGTAVERARLIATKRWSPILKQTEFSEDNFARPVLRCIARVHRGTATGGNDFFVMTQSEAQERGIAEFCVPVISRAKEIQDADGEIRNNADRMVVLVVPPNFERTSHNALDAYLKQGESKNWPDGPVSQRWIPSHRKSWYRVKVSIPPIVATYMARSAVRFAVNADGMALLNVGHGIYPKNPMRAEQIATLVERLNAMRDEFVGMGRTYHGGLEKFEPGEMEQLPIPREFAEPFPA